MAQSAKADGIARESQQTNNVLLAGNTGSRIRVTVFVIIYVIYKYLHAYRLPLRHDFRVRRAHNGAVGGSFTCGFAVALSQAG